MERSSWRNGLGCLNAPIHAIDSSTVVSTNVRNLAIRRMEVRIIVLVLLTWSPIVRAERPHWTKSLQIHVNPVRILLRIVRRSVSNRFHVVILVVRSVTQATAGHALRRSLFTVGAAGLHYRPYAIKERKSHLNALESAELP